MGEQGSSPDTQDVAVHQAVHVPLPPPEAFRLFTEGIGEWWPLEEGYSYGGDRAKCQGSLRPKPRSSACPWWRFNDPLHRFLSKNVQNGVRYSRSTACQSSLRCAAPTLPNSPAV